MFEPGFKFEFQKGRFPIRFCILAFIVSTIAHIFSLDGNWSSILSTQILITLYTYVGIFCGVSLILLWLFQRPISSPKPSYGIMIGWFIVVSVAVMACVILSYADQLVDEGLTLLQNPYLTPAIGYSTLFLSILLTPILLWLEKRIHSDKAHFIQSELQQFSNLDFRIRPHFLFNSLNSVAGLITQHPKRAETALYNLADVFRAVMADKRQLVPLKAELDMADKYLYLEKIRLGDRLEVSSMIDPNAVGIKVPVFLLQPLLENAVYHGIETRFKGGQINLNIQLKENQLIIKITNPLPDAGIKRKIGNKMAQQNLRQRIIAVFGGRASLDSYEAETSFIVIVRLPL